MQALDPATEAGRHALKGLGEDSVTMEETAWIDLSLPPSSNDHAYQAKYGHRIARNGRTPTWLAENYPIPIVIAPTRWRLVGAVALLASSGPARSPRRPS